MRTYDCTASVLRYNMFTGIAILFIGMAMSILDTEYSMDVVWLGILVLILSPFIGILVTAMSLAIEKDTKWLTVAVILITVTTAGMVISIF
ncbi:MAG: hypothetical protein WC067_01780 [Candidatus Methanomethylophilaceae archaeon]